jgi:SAM-dependent methyltransferase
MGPALFCKERGFNGICLGSGYHLPIRPGSLDVITLFDTIEHIEDDEQVLAECAVALRLGGFLVVTVPAYQFLYADNDRIAHHQRRYTLSRLKRITHATGLKVVKGTYYNVILFPIILPAILLLKIKQGLRGPLKKGEMGATNLSYRSPGPVKLALENVFSAERFILPWISAPFGHSIVLIARK